MVWRGQVSRQRLDFSLFGAINEGEDSGIGLFLAPRSGRFGVSGGVFHSPGTLLQHEGRLLEGHGVQEKFKLYLGASQVAGPLKSIVPLQGAEGPFHLSSQAADHPVHEPLGLGQLSALAALYMMPSVMPAFSRFIRLSALA